MISNRRIIRFLLQGQTLVDMTGFFKDPSRQGILRVGWELLRRWPENIVPVTIPEPGVLRILSPETEYEIASFFRDMPEQYEVMRHDIHSFPAQYRERVSRLKRFEAECSIECDVKIALQSARALVCYEVFFDQARLDAYLALVDRHPNKLFALCHDLLLWERSEFFPHVDWAHVPQLLIYPKFLRAANHVASNSGATAASLTKLKHRRLEDLPVLVLGADTFEPPATKIVHDVPHFVILGTVEPRKRTDLILQAFKNLEAQGKKFRCTIIGNKGWMPPETLRMFEDTVSTASWLKWEKGLADIQVEQIVGNATACIYISDEEGFGLPPLEALALGVPAIVSERLPALDYIDTKGQIRLKEFSAEGIEAAVKTFFDKGKSAKLREGADEVELPTWRGFAQGFSEWVSRHAGPFRSLPHPFTQAQRLNALATAKAEVSKTSMELFFAIFSRYPTLNELEICQTLADTAETLDQAIFSIGRERGEINSDELFSLIELSRLRSVKPVRLPSAILFDWAEECHKVLCAMYTRVGTEAFIDNIYSILVGRLPSTDELKLTDASKAAMILNLCESDFYRNQHHRPYDPDHLAQCLEADVAFDLEMGAIMALPDVNEFLAKAYQMLLKRSSDAEGTEYYCNRIRNGEPRSRIVAEICLAPEHEHHSTNFKRSIRAAVRYFYGDALVEPNGAN